MAVTHPWETDDEILPVSANTFQSVVETHINQPLAPTPSADTAIGGDLGGDGLDPAIESKMTGLVGTYSPQPLSQQKLLLRVSLNRLIKPRPRSKCSRCCLPRTFYPRSVRYDAEGITPRVGQQSDIAEHDVSVGLVLLGGQHGLVDDSSPRSTSSSPTSFCWFSMGLILASSAPIWTPLLGSGFQSA